MPACRWQPWTSKTERRGGVLVADSAGRLVRLARRRQQPAVYPTSTAATHLDTSLLFPIRSTYAGRCPAIRPCCRSRLHNAHATRSLAPRPVPVWPKHSLPGPPDAARAAAMRNSDCGGRARVHALPCLPWAAPDGLSVRGCAWGRLVAEVHRPGLGTAAARWRRADAGPTGKGRSRVTTAVVAVGAGSAWGGGVY